MHFVDNKDDILLPLFEGSTLQNMVEIILLIKWSSAIHEHFFSGTQEFFE